VVDRSGRGHPASDQRATRHALLPLDLPEEPTNKPPIRSSACASARRRGTLTLALERGLGHSDGPPLDDTFNLLGAYQRAYRMSFNRALNEIARLAGVRLAELPAAEVG
jgi:hypothetical protein